MKKDFFSLCKMKLFEKILEERIDNLLKKSLENKKP